MAPSTPSGASLMMMPMILNSTSESASITCATGLPRSPSKRQRAAEQHREQQHLQHVAGGEGVDHRGRDQLQQELDRAAAGELVGVSRRRRSWPRRRACRRVDVHADAGLEHEGQHQPERQGDGGQHLEVDQRLDADAAHALQVAGAGRCRAPRRRTPAPG